MSQGFYATPYRCSYPGCQRSYANRAALNGHCEVAHPGYTDPTPAGRPAAPAAVPSGLPTTSTGLPTASAGPPVTPADANTQNLPTSNALPHRCAVEGCNRAYGGSFGLKNHYTKKHPGFLKEPELPHPCPVLGCGKSFSRATGLSLHISISHSELNIKKEPPELPFKCDFPECNKSFSSAPGLSNHITASHRDRKKPPPGFDIKCDFCDSTFKTDKGRAIHVLSMHEDQSEKQTQHTFHCLREQCPLVFGSALDLRHHVDLVHQTSKTAPLGFVCDVDYSNTTTHSAMQNALSRQSPINSRRQASSSPDNASGHNQPQKEVPRKPIPSVQEIVAEYIQTNNGPEYDPSRPIPKRRPATREPSPEIAPPAKKSRKFGPAAFAALPLDDGYNFNNYRRRSTSLFPTDDDQPEQTTHVARRASKPVRLSASYNFGRAPTPSPRSSEEFSDEESMFIPERSPPLSQSHPALQAANASANTWTSTRSTNLLMNTSVASPVLRGLKTLFTRRQPARSASAAPLPLSPAPRADAGASGSDRPAGTKSTLNFSGRPVTPAPVPQPKKQEEKMEDFNSEEEGPRSDEGWSEWLERSKKQ